MELRQAYKLMAEALSRRLECYDKYFGEHGPYHEQYAKEQWDEIPQNVLEESELCDFEVEELGRQLATYPVVYSDMICWKIRITGESALTDENELPQDLEDPEEMLDFIAKCGGNLMATIQYQAEEEFDLLIADRGSGVGFWSLSLLCTEKEARKFCNHIHKRFRKAIESKLITMVRVFSGYRLRELLDEDDIEKWL